MRILFDQGVPVPLRTYLSPHEITTAYERGWSTLRNGDLLTAAEKEGFDVFITTDQNLRFEQNMSERSIAVLILSTTNWPRIKAAAESVVIALESVRTGFDVIDIP